MVKAHPETTFYFYTPPYSALWWYKTKCSGNLKRYFQAEQLQAELLLQYDNVKLFSFTDLFDLTCDLDNYKDDYTLQRADQCGYHGLDPRWNIPDDRS